VLKRLKKLKRFKGLKAVEGGLERKISNFTVVFALIFVSIASSFK